MVGVAQAIGLLNALELIDISNNIGDSRSLCCHPARPPIIIWVQKAAMRWAWSKECCVSTLVLKIRRT